MSIYSELLIKMQMHQSCEFSENSFGACSLLQEEHGAHTVNNIVFCCAVTKICITL